MQMLQLFLFLFLQATTIQKIDHLSEMIDDIARNFILNLKKNFKVS